MTRRALFAMAAAAVLDPERLLWKPGKLISIPKPQSFPYPFGLTIEEFDELYVKPAMARVAEEWKKEYDFYAGEAWVIS